MNPRTPWSVTSLRAQHLPQNWPAVRAEEVFHALALEYDKTTTPIAATVLETIPTVADRRDAR